MNLKVRNKTIHAFLKGLSCVCILISIVLLFQGWITVVSSQDQRDIRKEVRRIQNYLDDIESDEIEYLQDELEEEDFDFSIKRALKYAEQGLDVVKDTSISPKEVATLTPNAVKILNAYEDSDLVEVLLEEDLFMDIADETGKVKACLILTMILFYLTLIMEVLNMILHILNKKAYGVTTIFFNIILMIIFGIICIPLNDVWLMEIGDKIVRLSAVPYFAVALSIVAAIAWYFARKFYGLQDVPIALKGNMMFCPNCGKVIAEDADFCPYCGKSTDITSRIN